jgi:hypothetical protein
LVVHQTSPRCRLVALSQIAVLTFNRFVEKSNPISNQTEDTHSHVTYLLAAQPRM